jgi:diguanylate cyclase (GGDEF)-like protein
MILTVLIINDSSLDLCCIKGYFKASFCKIIESKSVEDALRVVGRSHLDLVLLVLSSKNQVYMDFLSVLRMTLGVTPLIGVADLCSPTDFSLFADKGVDDIIYSSISEDDLFRRICSMSRAKEKMYSSFLIKDVLGRQKYKKITIFSENHFNLFDKDFLGEDTVINFARRLSDIKNCSSSDIFLIDAKLRNVEGICARLRLSRVHRYKPILIIAEKKYREKSILMYNRNVGVLDVLDVDIHPSIISCKVNAHIKYKRLLDGFYREVKKNIYMSSVDTLTSVYNRSFLEEYIAKREDAMNHSAVLMIDLDKFKEINDKYGHSFADRVLSEIAAHIKSYIRVSDFIARYGGDEFIVFLRNLSFNEIEKISERLVRSVERKLFNGIHCTISVGACYIEMEKVKLREAIFIADNFMYISKKSGGNSAYLC